MHQNTRKLWSKTKWHLFMDHRVEGSKLSSRGLSYSMGDTLSSCETRWCIAHRVSVLDDFEI